MWFGKSEIQRDSYETSPVLLNVNGKISVNLNMKQPGEIRMSAIDLNGRKIQTMRCVSNRAGMTNAALDLKIVNPGVYILKISTDEQSWVQKIVKN